MERTELEGKKVPELKELAKAKGIHGYDSMNKAKLVEAILGPESTVKNEGKPQPFNKVPGKYLKLNSIIKGEN